MYICLCKGVTDHKIRQVVAEGARSWREVRKVGKCACSAKAIAQHAIKDTLAASADDLAYAI